MTRVMHVFGTMDIGGAELRTLDVMREIRERGIEFEFATLTGRPGRLDDEIIGLGGRVHPTPLGAGFPARFVRLLKSREVDSVHSHVATFSGLILLLAKVAGVRHRVAHFRSDGDGKGTGPRRVLQRLVMRWLIGRCATHIVGVSPSALSLGYRADWAHDPRAQVIVNGLTPFSGTTLARADLGVSDAALVLTHVGRGMMSKNRQLAVRILKALRSSGLDAHLLLVGGSGEDREVTTAVIDELDVRTWVHELGQISTVRDVLALSDVHVLTSSREGLPGVVLEANSTGTPSVASDLPGVAFIAESLAGIVMRRPDDDVDLWASSVVEARSAWASQETRARMREGFVGSQFSLESVVEKYTDLYQGQRP